MNGQTNFPNDLSRVSNYASNIRSLCDDNANPLVKEFREGQIRDKGLIGRTASQAQTLFWGGFDWIRGSNHLASRQKTRENELLEKNWNYHKPSAQPIPQPAAIAAPPSQNYPELDPEDIYLVNKITAQFASHIGDNAPLEFLHQGVAKWVEKDNQNVWLSPQAKTALAAIYNSGIDPQKLELIANKNYKEDSITPDDLATLIQVIHVFDAVSAYAKTMDHDKKNLCQVEPDGTLTINYPLLGSLSVHERQALETYVNTINLMPQKTVEQIGKIGNLLQNPNLFAGSPIRDIYLAELQRAHLSPDIPIENRVPVPTQKQLEIAVKLAYQMFADAPRFETQQAQAFFARTIQCMLVGEQLPFIPYPQDDCCFTYQEIRIQPEMAYHFNVQPASKKYNLLDWEALRKNYLDELQKEKISSDVQIKDGAPAVSRQQWERAFAQASKLFPDLSAFHEFTNRQAFTRLMQYILVGEAHIAEIDYPDEESTPAYQDLLKHSNDTVPPNFTLGFIHKNGGLPKAFQQFLMDYSRSLPAEANIITLNGKSFNYPKNTDDLDILLHAFIQDFNAQAKDPNFLGSFKELIPHLPVSDKDFNALVKEIGDQDIKERAIEKEELRKQGTHEAELNAVDQKPTAKGTLAKTLHGFRSISDDNGQLNLCWRVAMLQLLLHLHQGMSGELLAPNVALTLPLMDAIPDLMPATVPLGHTIRLQQKEIGITGAVNIEVKNEVLGESQKLPNFTSRLNDQTPFTTIIRTTSSFTAPLHLMQGAHSATTCWQLVTIPPHMIFHPELLVGLVQKSKPLPVKSPFILAKALVEEIQKVSIDNLKTILQDGKPSTWDDIDTLMSCLNIGENTHFMENLKADLNRNKRFMTRTPEGYYQIKEGLSGRNDITQTDLQSTRELVETMNLLRPHLDKISDIRKVASLAKTKACLSKLGKFHELFLIEHTQRFQRQHPGMAVSKEVSVVGNEVKPTPLQLSIAFDFIRNAQEKGLPESISKSSKAFLGRLTQLILVGPVVIDALAYPEDEFTTTMDLEGVVRPAPSSAGRNILEDFKETEVVLPGNLGRQVISSADLIRKRLHTFVNTQSKFICQNSVCHINQNPEVLESLLSVWKADFYRWIGDPANLHLALKQLDQARNTWKMELSIPEIESLFWNSDMGAWAKPIAGTLASRGALPERLWAFHLLQIALTCQPASSEKHFKQDVASMIDRDSSAYQPVTDQIEGIYNINGPFWIANYTLPLRKGNDPHVGIKTKMRVVQEHVYQTTSPQQVSVGPVKFSPFGKEAISTVQRNLLKEDPAAGAL